MLALAVSAVAAPSAFALTQGQANEHSLLDAELKWGAGASRKECVNSGKNEHNVAQYFCNGHLFGGEEWKINLDPFGVITFERK
jgi:hypothetical protein